MRNAHALLRRWKFLNPHCKLCLTRLKRYCFLRKRYSMRDRKRVEGRQRSLSSSHAIIDRQKHSDRRSKLFYKRFSDYWVINKWSRQLLSHQQSVLGVHRLWWLFYCMGTLAVTNSGNVHICRLCRLLSNLLSFTVWSFVRRFLSIAAIRLTSSRREATWPNVLSHVSLNISKKGSFSAGHHVFSFPTHITIKYYSWRA